MLKITTETMRLRLAPLRALSKMTLRREMGKASEMAAILYYDVKDPKANVWVVVAKVGRTYAGWGYARILDAAPVRPTQKYKEYWNYRRAALGLYVIPEFRRRGVGIEIMKGLERVTRFEKIPKSRLGVLPHDTKGRSFFKRFGLYTPDPEEREEG